MAAFAALLGIDAESWGVIVAAAALAVSVYSVLGARGSAAASKRSARAAESSARHSDRSAAAAERLAAANERAVELDEQRSLHESRERADRDAPRWAALADDEGAWWISDDGHLEGVLVNRGRVEAAVTRVVLDLPAGGQLTGRYRAEPPGSADGGFVSTLTVRAGAAMRVQFQTTDGSLGHGIAGDVRPRVTVAASSDELGWRGDRVIELLRRSGGVTSAIRWKPRAVD